LASFCVGGSVGVICATGFYTNIIVPFSFLFHTVAASKGDRQDNFLSVFEIKNFIKVASTGFIVGGCITTSIICLPMLILKSGNVLKLVINKIKK
jgi:hypothetical protein